MSYIPGPPRRTSNGGTPLILKKSHKRTLAQQLPTSSAPTSSASASTASKPAPKPQTLSPGQRFPAPKALSSHERLSATTLSSTPPTATSTLLAATQEAKEETLSPSERFSASKASSSSQEFKERTAALTAKLAKVRENIKKPLPRISEDSPFTSMCDCILRSVLHDCNHLVLTCAQKCVNWKEDAPCKETIRRRGMTEYDDGACPKCKAEKAEKELHQKNLEDVKKKRTARVSMEDDRSTASEDERHGTALEPTREEVANVEQQVEGTSQHSKDGNLKVLPEEVQRQGLNIVSSESVSQEIQAGLLEMLKSAKVASAMDDPAERARNLQILVAKTMMRGAVQDAFKILGQERTWRHPYHVGMEAKDAMDRFETAAREGNEKQMALEKEKFFGEISSYTESLENVHKAAEVKLLEECEEVVQLFFETLLG